MRRLQRLLRSLFQPVKDALYPSVSDPYRDRTTPAQYRDRVRRQEEHTKDVLRRRGVYEPEGRL